MPADCDIYNQKLSDKQFAVIQQYIHNNCGIKLPETKKSMVEGRIRKRLKALGMSSYNEYIETAFDPTSEIFEHEQLALIDVITTNKTDFFREPNHFTFLTQDLLGKMERMGIGTSRCLNIWSSACSTGEEPYTMAMVLADYFGLDGNFRIYATDISYSVLEKAIKGIYSAEKAVEIPYEFKKKYLMRSKKPGSSLVRFIPEIRNKITFGRLNLMDNEYHLPVEMDIVFCRNVIIYFEHNTQHDIIRKICSNITSGGYLFLGHSESIHGMDLPLETVVPTVFLRV